MGAVTRCLSHGDGLTSFRRRSPASIRVVAEFVLSRTEHTLSYVSTTVHLFVHQSVDSWLVSVSWLLSRVNWGEIAPACCLRTRQSRSPWVLMKGLLPPAMTAGMEPDLSGKLFLSKHLLEHTGDSKDGRENEHLVFKTIVSGPSKVQLDPQGLSGKVSFSTGSGSPFLSASLPRNYSTSKNPILTVPPPSTP